jgi:hypothetical protein
MVMLQESLFELLKDCTVRLDLNSSHSGTGFFIAPGYILTCAHVVEASKESPELIKAYYSGGLFPIREVAKFFPKPYPDLALLRFTWESHPCVELNPTVNPYDQLYVFGYPEQTSQGAPLTLEFEGWEQVDPIQKRLKLKQGQVEPGFSGSPVLNLDTGCVCGVLKSSRHRMSDMGGWAISIETVMSVFTEVVKLNANFHQQDLRWKQARRVQELHDDVPVGEDSNKYNKRAIRELLESGFTVSDFIILCEDVEDFKEARKIVNPDMSLQKTVIALMGYAERKILFQELLAWAKAKNRRVFAKFQPYIIEK